MKRKLINIAFLTLLLFTFYKNGVIEDKVHILFNEVIRTLNEEPNSSETRTANIAELKAEADSLEEQQKYYSFGSFALIVIFATYLGVQKNKSNDNSE